MVLTHIRMANETLGALPLWAKIAVTVQCALPGAVLWLQMQFLTHRSSGIEAASYAFVALVWVNTVLVVLGAALTFMTWVKRSRTKRSNARWGNLG